jgi:hypothetical protein
VRAEAKRAKSHRSVSFTPEKNTTLYFSSDDDESPISVDADDDLPESLLAKAKVCVPCSHASTHPRHLPPCESPTTRPRHPMLNSDETVANRYVGGFGWEIAHAATPADSPLHDCIP